MSPPELTSAGPHVVPQAVRAWPAAAPLSGAPVAAAPVPLAEPGRAEVLVFAFRDMRFALPSASVVEVVPLEGARWDKMARMAAAGTLGVSGLPLIRLAVRLGFAPERPARGALVLFGTAGKVRATVLIDDMPRRMMANLELMPAAWRQDFWPCEDLVGGVARLPDGGQAALVELPIGVVQPRPPVAEPRRDSAHLLVRAGRTEPEAVRVAALRGMSPIDDIHRGAGIVSLKPGRRMLLLIGGEGDALAVDEVLGLAPQGRVERVDGARYLATAGGRYRLLEPGETVPAPARTCRVLVAAPEGEARAGLRDLVRAMGHDVSLADDPRAAELAGGRFDIILFDLDAYGTAAGITGSARRIGLSARVEAGRPDGFHAVVATGDVVALIAAMLPDAATA
ncbi:chemotaxis protein CheW [Ancylobacter radicis]|uniref:Chemotaxis protein CheW n=1 Tax=Ancylobacter radicis TaxID=2836179 RepID=A0ABS5RDL2_9HYPH|nr:chemotaxis protein CheW [Ancylobacter radicis]MBS9478437.1 chemotaxis protein CheW [Ancylobacter radicis]